MKPLIIILLILLNLCSHKERNFFESPDQLNDGIQTATLKEVGIDESIIKSMQDSITTVKNKIIKTVEATGNGG